MQNNLDPIVIAGHAIAATLGAIVGVPVSGVIADAAGAYVIIVIVAAIGASWALGDRAQTSRMSAAWYFTRVTATATLLTAVVSGFASQWLGVESERALLIPVAFVLGMVGDNWPTIRQKGAELLMKVINSRTGADK